jgi:1-acyl-sn-glycerol-3-phosphate acyltransferase
VSSPEPGPSVPGQGPRVLVRPTLTYHVVRICMRLWFRLYFGRRLEGHQRVPQSGGILLVSNHQSFLDIPLISIATTRHVSFVARRSLARLRWLDFVMRECGAVLIEPGKPDRAALREMIAHLEAGDAVAIFPEGTRSSDGRLQEFRHGALLAARQAQVPIVPLGIRGTIDAWPRKARLPRPRRVALRFGDPIDSAAPDALEQVRAAIQAMVGSGHYDSVAPGN